METTTVFSMRSLTTLPTLDFLRLRASVSVVIRLLTPFECAARHDRPGRDSGISGLRGALPLVQHGEQPRHFTPALADAQRVVELLHGIPEAQVEHLLAQLGDAAAHLIQRLVAQRRSLHVSHFTLLPERGVPRTVCGSEASRRRASWRPAPAASRSLPARTSPVPA